MSLSTRSLSVSSTHRNDYLRPECEEARQGRLAGISDAVGARLGFGRGRLRSLFRNSSARRLLRVSNHVLAIALLFPLAIAIQYGWVVPRAVWLLAAESLPIVVGCKMAAILATGCLRSRARDASFVAVVALVEAATLGALGLLMIRLLFGAGGPLSVSIIAIDWALTVLGFVGYRVSTRLIRERYVPVFRKIKLERVLVVGATEDTATIIRAIHQEQRFGLEVVGVIDRDPSALGSSVGGIEVLGSLDEVGHLAKLHRIASVLITSADLSAGNSSTLLTNCQGAGVAVRSIPSLEALIRGRLTAQPRDVDPSELLCREPVEIDGESIGEFLRGSVVLVTGAAGSIGSEICRQVLTFAPRQLILLDHSENGLFFLERQLRDLIGTDTELHTFPASITDNARLRVAFDRHRPAVVFHAAAHKHVPMMEAHPGEAVKNNVFGTKSIVDESIRAGVKSFVLISTDKAVCPSSVMGACKRLAEMYLQSLSRTTSTRLVAVRFGNVIGSAGSVVPVFKQQIRSGGPLTVTHPDMTRYFMTIPEAARLVLQAGAIGEGGEIFFLEMGKPVKIANLARNLIRLSGLDVGRDVEIVYTGIRPGEKLHEDLHEIGEASVPTIHPKIVRLAQSSPPLPDLLQDLDRLARTSNGPSESIIRVLAEVVPGYRPRNREAPCVNGAGKAQRGAVADGRQKWATRLA